MKASNSRVAVIYLRRILSAPYIHYEEDSGPSAVSGRFDSGGRPDDVESFSWMSVKPINPNWYGEE